MSITSEEQLELKRLITGGAYNEGFWRQRLSLAREARAPSDAQLLRSELASLPRETVQDLRQVRKLERRLHKLKGAMRAKARQPYAADWSAEERRIDNLQHAAVYIHRAHTGFHFFA